MHNDNSASPTRPDAEQPAQLSGVMSTEALARRRVLLKGLGKGSAALAVVVPIQTLAANTIIGGTKLCTVSGVQSSVGSHPLGTVTTCSGYSPTHFQTLANWPTTLTVDTINFTSASPFNTIFTGGISSSLNTVLTTLPASDETVWITALLNALLAKPGFNFPYTASQVRAFYTGGGTGAVNALAFFKGYMQSIA